MSIPALGQPMAQHGLSGGVDVGVAFKNGAINPSLTYYELISLAQGKTIFIGWTGRLSSFYGRDLDYYTAPARLTRGTSGLGALFTPLLEQNMDTIRFNQVGQTALTIGIRAEVHLGRLELGASLDLLGFTIFRKSRTGLMSSSTGLFTLTDSAGRSSLKPFQGAYAMQTATPHRFSLRLLGDNDYGMLSTEVYARFRLADQLRLKIVYQWINTEMVLSNPDQVTHNDRFRNRVDFLYLGFTIPIEPW
ncbi:hypothetical protein GCM10028809_56950 [Spirosoma gilvum]